MEGIKRSWAKVDSFLKGISKSLDFEKILIFVFVSVIFFLVFSYMIPSFLFRWNDFLSKIVLYRGRDIENIKDVPNIIQFISLMVFTLLIYIITLKKKRTISYITFFTLNIIYILAVGVFFELDWKLNLLVFLLALNTVWLIALFSKYKDEASDVFGLKQAVSQYVSPQIMKRIMSNPESLRLGGNTRKMTVLFTDIRNFTAISENFPAKRLMNFVNEYFDHITKTILRNDGTIDKFAGDSLLAFWNAPVKDPEHALRACITALKINEDLKDFNNNGNKKIPTIRTGIGINTGEIVVGNVGSKNRFDYTVIGDNVNVASRLEGLTKKYRVPVLLGQNTVLELKKTATFSEFSIRFLDLVRVKGKDESMGVYELMGPRDKTLDSLRDEYEKAFALYKRKRFNEASKSFIDILGQVNDHASKMLLVRCYNFIEDPPKDDWDGSWEWGSK